MLSARPTRPSTNRGDRLLAMPIEHVETLIVGGGQAGLALSHRLRQRGCPHLVLERGRIAERWRTERWDGLRFMPISSPRRSAAASP